MEGHPLASNRFRICTFNLLNYVVPPNAFYDSENIYTKREWSAKQDWIRRQLALLSADIIGFQEVFSPDSLQGLLREMGYPYFATVEEPGIGQAHVYNKPVLAVASRFPIENVSGVRAAQVKPRFLTLPEGFEFSRMPIRAEIYVDGLGSCLFYVVHLKSKRNSLLDSVTVDNEEEMMLVHSQGQLASTLQRGLEIAVLQQDMIQQTQWLCRPLILVGDFNDSIGSASLNHIMSAPDASFIQTAGIDKSHYMEKYVLTDSYCLWSESKAKDRRPTHYWGGQGSVLDYVLVSKDFHPEYRYNLGAVTSYIVSDQHLINPSYEVDSQCSDHAPVVVEFEIRE